MGWGSIEEAKMGSSSSRLGLGGSIPVRNVQDLASSSSSNLKEIPKRYIRPELIEFDKVLMDDSLQIPVIDMLKMAAESSDDYENEMQKLHQACKDWGFFQVFVL